ncbi:Trm112 family protein [Paraneptunicella aestuarii]|uniref:Trm112 family protein n=1 Tax=Paraneptunicella aestuarii TaxID=2831148 RepID=UPI001E2B7E6B|nr:Trm112 family protein [Paraneptunicella aestuarii]UAA40523.1 Trm112 family protein [Paraneptunicella aestuarii]
MSFDKKLLEVIACPVCKGKLIYLPEQHELVCAFDRLAYPIRENIPVMIESEAREMTSTEVEELKK